MVARSTFGRLQLKGRKNMVQQWQTATGYTLEELGIAPWVTKAQQQAQKVLQLVTVRVDNESVGGFTGIILALFCQSASDASKPQADFYSFNYHPAE